MEKEPEPPEAVDSIAQNRRKCFSFSGVVAVFAAWFFSTGVFVLWMCMDVGFNIDNAASSPVRSTLFVMFAFFSFGVITAFPLEIAVIFVYSRMRLWVKILVSFLALLCTVGAAYIGEIMCVLVIFAGW